MNVSYLKPLVSFLLPRQNIYKENLNAERKQLDADSFIRENHTDSLNNNEVNSYIYRETISVEVIYRTVLSI